MTKLSPQQVAILRLLRAGEILIANRPSSMRANWRWTHGEAADHWAIGGLIHRGEPLVRTVPYSAETLQGLLTDAGRAALAAAKEGT